MSPLTHTERERGRERERERERERDGCFHSGFYRVLNSAVLSNRGKRNFNSFRSRSGKSAVSQSSHLPPFSPLPGSTAVQALIGAYISTLIHYSCIFSFFFLRAMFAVLWTRHMSLNCTCVCARNEKQPNNECEYIENTSIALKTHSYLTLWAPKLVSVGVFAFTHVHLLRPRWCCTPVQARSLGASRLTSVSSPLGTEMRALSNHTEPCFSSCRIWLATTLTIFDSTWPFCGPTAKYQHMLLSIVLNANYKLSPRLDWQLMALEQSGPVTSWIDVCTVLLSFVSNLAAAKWTL